MFFVTGFFTIICILDFSVSVGCIGIANTFSLYYIREVVTKLNFTFITFILHVLYIH